MGDYVGLSDSEPLVYIDHSDIREGRLEDLKAGVRRLVDFVETNEPQLVSYGFHIDDQAAEMTVVAIHPDSASLEFHMEVAGTEFRRLADMITLRRIEVYGRPSGRAIEYLRQKAEVLGGGSVLAIERFAGFVRLGSSKA
jgi:hypothetical protein